MERKRNGTSKLDLINKIESKQEEIKSLQYKLWKKLKEKQSENSKVIDQEITDRWSMYQGDCISVIKGIPDNSVHYSIFSPPFLSLYVYSSDYRDMGNSKGDDLFYDHFSYLIPELYRIIKPGRLVSVHCSVVNMSITHDGILGLKDLPGQLVRLFQEFGFIYHSKVTVWKDPLIQAVRTKNITLAHKQIVKDSSRCTQGFADEILTFRKPGENKEPVHHKKGFDNYIGELPEPSNQKNPDPKLNKYSHYVWQRYASPVWMDINQTDTLNVRLGRDDKDEKHICPLQLGLIARCLELWTNPNDIVLSPFAGIGSEGYESVSRNRKFIGIELKKSYYKQAVKNLILSERRPKSIFHKK